MKKILLFVPVIGCLWFPGFLISAEETAVPKVTSVTDLAFREITVRGHKELDDSIFNTTKTSVTDNYSRSRSLDKNLEGQLGIDIKNNGYPGSLATFSVRGGTANQSLVAIEDVPMNDIELGSFDLSVFPSSLFTSMEVIRDGGSSIFGPNASSGYLGLTTPDRTEKSFLRLNPGLGSYGGLDVSADAGLKCGDNFFLFPGVRYTRSKNDYPFSYNTTNSVRSNSQYTNVNFSLNAVFRNNFLKMKSFSFFNWKMVGTPGKGDGQDLKAYQENRDAFSVLKTAIYFPIYTELILSYYYSWKNIFNFSQSQYEHVQWYGKLTQEEDLQFLSAMHGLEVRYYIVESTDVGKRERLLVSPFLSLQKYLFGNALKITGKTRYDINDVYGNILTGSAGFNLKLPWKNVLRAGIGTSFREPDFSSLYTPDNPMYFYKGDPNLKPEYSLDIDAGLENNFLEPLTIQISAFQNSYKNLIVWGYYDPVNPAYSVPKNISTARYTGVEGGLEIRAVSLLKGKINYTYLLAQDQSGTNTGKILPYEPFHRLTASVDIRFWQILLSVTGHYQGIAYLKEAKEGSDVKLYNDRLTMDVFMEIMIINGLSVNASCDNLTDIRYTTYVGSWPIIGRTFKVQAAWKIE
jgi:vitamin B12 transporter